MLVNIIHAEDPSKVADSIRNSIDGIEEDEERTESTHPKLYPDETDLQAIDNLKQKRQLQGFNREV